MESKNLITVVLVAVVILGVAFAFLNFKGDGEVTEIVEDKGPSEGTVALVFEEPEPRPSDAAESGEETS